MPIILTITNENFILDGTYYDYSKTDRLLKNICKDDEYEIFYSGQNQGKLDKDLIKAINNDDLFNIYYRNKQGISFKYLGYTNKVDIIQYRTARIGYNSNIEERLQIHLIVNDVFNSEVPKNFEGTGRYKKDILLHSGLRDINNKIIIPHNKNINLGFYYYENK
tara:strand:- start:40 stop:531 length:492 start_codon:yes stop_codon:yes gene_type:complete